MPHGLKGWAGFLAAQVVLTFAWHWIAKLAEHAMLTWSDDQIAALLGFSAPEASTVISWTLPALLGIATLWIYHVYQQHITRTSAPATSQSSARNQNTFAIRTGTGPDYDTRSPSHMGIVHCINVQLNNGTSRLLTGGTLLVSHLSPADNTGVREFSIKANLTIPPGEQIPVCLASHNEEASPGTMSLQYQRFGAFLAPVGKGKLVGEHSFDLRFICNQQVTDEIHCRLLLDGNKIMRLERV